jgi:hypothetical protein
LPSIFAFLSELVGECHGFGLKGFRPDVFDPLLELGNVFFCVENVPLEPLQSTVGNGKQKSLIP